MSGMVDRSTLDANTEAAPKKQRGRPRLISVEEMRRNRSMFPDLKSDRQHQNHDYAYQAMRILGLTRKSRRQNSLGYVIRSPSRQAPRARSNGRFWPSLAAWRQPGVLTMPSSPLPCGFVNFARRSKKALQ